MTCVEKTSQCNQERQLSASTSPVGLGWTSRMLHLMMSPFCCALLFLFLFFFNLEASFTICPPLDSISIKSCSQLPQWDLPGQFLLHVWSPRLPVFNDVVLFFALSIRLLQSSQLL